MFRTPANDTVVSIYKPVDLPVVNFEELAGELDVINLAKQQARMNLPETDAKEIDANELQFKSKIKTKSFQAVHSVDQSISALRNELQSITISREISDAREIGVEFKKKINAEWVPQLKELEELKRDYSSAVDDVNEFKRSNSIRRSASYPDSKWMTIGVLLIALIVESILNGHFFADGVDTGLIGGVFQAGVIAVVNIGFGFILGWWLLPYKNHCNKSISNLALFGFVSFLFVPLVFNLLVGHYREALVFDPDNAHLLALESFSNGILLIGDFNSWVLFSIGMMFSVLAMYKGYVCDDRYPGYGRLARQVVVKEGELNEVREELIQDLEERHDRCLEKLEDHYKTVLHTEKKLGHLSSAIDHQDRILTNYVRHLEDALCFVVKLYRETNSSERSTEKPVYYSDAYDADLEFEGVDVEYKDKRDEIASGKEELTALMPEIRSSMLDSKEEYSRMIDGVC